MNANVIHPVLGIDFGDARIGIAASDALGIMAHPVETIHRTQVDPVTRIGEILRLRSATALVIGMPLRLDGSEGTAAEKVRAFAKQLAEAYPRVPQYFADESFSTMTAAGKLREAGRNAKQQKAIIDQAAAVEILQSWMDRNAPEQDY
jgi:putative Holliday junction resolvase